MPAGCLDTKQNIYFGEIYTEENYFCTANFVDHNHIVREKIKCGIKHLVPSALYDMVVHQSPGAS